jgi:hypothetical protein
MSIKWPFAATGASISAVNVTVQPALSGLPFGAAQPTAKGVPFVSEQIGALRRLGGVGNTGAAQRGLLHEGMSFRIAAGTGTTTIR